jgi:NAD(P)-dependent dehydrogenase (short-subunit alcohol dehydrogenase family)
MQLEGRVALVTGGGTGIGAGVVERFVAEGARVLITGRRKEMLDKMAASLPAGSVTTFVGDVCQDGNAERMVQAALGIGGKLDILVNNAAIEANAPVVDMDPAVWRQTVEVNLTGPFLMMKAAIPKMIEGGGGSIINVASLAGVVARVLRNESGSDPPDQAGGVRLRQGQRALQRDLPRPRAHDDAREQFHTLGEVSED